MMFIDIKFFLSNTYIKTRGLVSVKFFNFKTKLYNYKNNNLAEKIINMKNRIKNVESKIKHIWAPKK